VPPRLSRYFERHFELLRNHLPDAALVELFVFLTIQRERQEGEDDGQRATHEVLPIAKDADELAKMWQT
jgi:hypothetical protein